MKRFRSTRMTRKAVFFAVLGLLFQAALAVTHATAMLALAAGQEDGGVQTAMMCHGGVTLSDAADGPPGEKHGAKLVHSCPCCLGMVSAAIAPASPADIARPAIASDHVLAAPVIGLASGRHRLAPDSRGPPRLA